MLKMKVNVVNSSVEVAKPEANRAMVVIAKNRACRTVITLGLINCVISNPLLYKAPTLPTGYTKQNSYCYSYED